MYKNFKEHEIHGLDHNLIIMLDQAVDIAKVPFIITSGKRTPEQDRNVGGSGNGSHTKGLAVDLRCKDSRSRFRILKGLIYVNFTRIGIEKDHIHADIDTNKDIDVAWLE